MLRLLAVAGMLPLENNLILDVGCGTGQWLRDFVKWGASPDHLFGIDLLADRIAQARDLCPPGVTLECGSAAELPWPDDRFDLVLQSTLFTSILDRTMRRAVASELVRVVRPGGMILWYDYHVNNPRNVDVRGVGRREIAALFPQCVVSLSRITLAPPLARALARHSWILCHVLERIPLLCTHYLGVVRNAKNNTPPSGWTHGVLKRSLDLVLAVAGLVMLAPVLLGIALLIKVDSSGPALYRQERVGRGFRRFRMFKFRTMVVGADRLGGALSPRGDPRVTRLGKVLRRFKLDELPQLLNVAAGEMSLVGPRPEVPAYVEQFAEDYETILTVRPGVTDLASLKYRDEGALLAHASDAEAEYLEVVLPEKIRLAKAYIRCASLQLDITLIVLTMGALIGARPPRRMLEWT